MSNSNTSSGIGLLGALTLIFIVLKLTEVGAVAHWSWFWVLSPTLIPWMIILAVLAVYLPVSAVSAYFKRRGDLRRFMDGE